MSKFLKLFGIRPQEVKKTCVLLPYLPKGALAGFGIKHLARGKLYRSGNSQNFTLIQTGIGAGFTGDAVLYLKETACRNLILFGSCGLVKKRRGLDIGSLVAPLKAYDYESFSRMLLEKGHKAKSFSADSGLARQLLRANPEILKVNCATLASLKLEEERAASLARQAVAVVDMECSAFFAAAKFLGVSAVALFYVSDIIRVKPFYALDLWSKAKTFAAIKKSLAFLCRFIQEELSG